MLFHGLDLNLLAVLDALFETRSVTKAAKRLELSQPATSAALARLREYFKEDLFTAMGSIDGGKEMVPTAFGVTLIDPVRNILADIRATIRCAPNFSPERSTRHIRIVASEHMEMVFVGDVVSRAATIAPHMTFEIVNSISAEFIRTSMKRAEIDFVVAPIMHICEDQPKTFLFRETAVFLAAKENSRIGEWITLEQLANFAFVDVVQLKGSKMDPGEQRLVAQVQPPDPQIRISSFHSFPLYIVGSDRLCLIGDMMAGQLARRWPLKVARFRSGALSFDFFLQWNSSSEQDPAQKWFRELAIEAAQTIPAGKQ
jgi:LysR family nod box-dependent transcriptional activator